MDSTQIRKSIGAAALGLLIWVVTQVIIGQSIGDISLNPLTIAIGIIFISLIARYFLDKDAT